jgi:N-acetylneuraminate synthase
MTSRNEVFVIAEAGSNWRAGTPERDLEMAFALIDVAVEAGADAVKFQTYRAASLYALAAGESSYLAELGIKRSINEVLQDLEMPYEMIAKLAARCSERGIEFMSTPFSVADADAIDPFVGRHKVASYEINHVRLLERLAAKGKPLIVSTGAAGPDDITFLLETIRRANGGPVTLLQCTSSYPAPPDSLNLLAIPWLARTFGVPVGFSDHSLEPVVGPVVAVALGATVIEKHYTLNRRLPGPDHPFAIEPAELSAMVKAIRLATQARGVEGKPPIDAESELRAFAVRSIQAIRDIAAGEELVEGVNFNVLRPGSRRRGLHPRHLDALAGKHAVTNIPSGEGIRAEDVSPPVDDVA